MRVADFIDAETDAILSGWEEIARTLLPAASSLDNLALRRDHAGAILRAVSADLRAPQTRLEQDQKSRGEAPVTATAPETAAQLHAVLRAMSGFSIGQLVSEYRALRASVLRHYFDREGHQMSQLSDLGRFNEAIDQALAKSVDYFTAEVDRWRNIFLGVLGHDLRGPLNSIQLTAKLISLNHPSPELETQMDRLMRSGQRMAELLDDLLDFNRVSMGGRLEVEPRPGDLVETCRQEVEMQRSAHPSARIEFEAPSTCPGVWDVSRIRQAVGNLIGNAIKYGDEGSVRVVVQCEGEHVRVHVDNHGPTLEAAELDLIFDPLFRGSAGASNKDPGHLGLGLFIVRQAAEAHGGTVEVQSANRQTHFSIVLPRDASLPHGNQGVMQELQGMASTTSPRG
ncbi:MAG: sensor histidine kinase [Burkholderiales bacterium]|nr:sensor histidine kinase [Burkholderiales bacterium]